MATKLTPFSRLLIVLVLLAGLFFLGKKFIPQFGSKMEMPSAASTTSTNGASTNTPTGNTASTSSSTAAPASTKHFEYNAPTPMGGKLKGVVELGATGFNSFIITADANKNWKLEKADFGTSLVYEKLATDQDVKDGLKKYIADMLAFGVSPKDIHFVISSGAQKVDITKKITDYLKSMKYFVNEVTAEKEGQLGYQSVMPQGYEQSSFVADIGSGNTKIAWKENGALKAMESYGSKYFQNNITDDQAYSTIRGKAAQVPATLRKTCFIIGGVPFEFAKQVRNGKERFTVLNAPDKYTPADARGKCGQNIYKAIADATGCQQFVFDWDANFTIGFLLGLPN
ncbi:MAG: hypothetical protein ABI844_05445 [Saprospiraceae bacterium]